MPTPIRDGLSALWFVWAARLVVRDSEGRSCNEVVGLGLDWCSSHLKEEGNGKRQRDCIPAIEAPEPIKMQHEPDRLRGVICRAGDTYGYLSLVLGPMILCSHLRPRMFGVTQGLLRRFLA